MITKGEPGLERAIRSAIPAVDEVVLVFDPSDAEKVANAVNGIRDIPIRLAAREWESDFAAQRRHSFALCNYEWVLWLDSDDELIGAEELYRWFQDQLAENPNRPWYACGLYHYEHDDAGTCVRSQMRERLVPRKLGDWQAPIHEIWSPQNIQHCRPIPWPKAIYVKHHLRVGDPVNVHKRLRNLEIMEATLKEQEKPDRRLILHYAMGLLGLERFVEARQILGAFIKEEPRGWSRHRALMIMAQTYQAEKNWTQLEYVCCLALAEVPDSLEPAVKMFEASILQNRYREALLWFRLAYESGDRQTDMTIHDPRVQVPDYYSAAMAAIEISEHARAIHYAGLCGDKRLRDEIKGTVQDAEAVDAFLKSTAGKTEKQIVKAAKKLPSRLHDFPQVGKYLLPNIPRGKRSLCIFCGPEGYGGGQSEFWGPDSIKDGIGGSEEAVIRVAPLLAKRGMHVEVYGPWPKNEVRDGVHWIRHDFFRTDRPFDVFVAWRYAFFTQLATAAKTRILWMHDAAPAEMIKPYAESIEEIWALSEYHREWFQKDLPYMPIWVTSNGIPDLEPYHSNAKVPGKAIYSSSPDRGLNLLLQWWPEIQAQVPEATLHIFYGFNQVWRRMEASQPWRKEYRAWVAKMVEELPGVEWHGNVGQDELHRQMSESVAWLYPTEFNEISCITAMKAQALGTVPVCSRYAALNETVQDGIVLGSAEEPDIQKHKEEFIAQAVSALKGELSMKHRRGHWNDHFSWDRVAESWANRMEALVRESAGSTRLAV